MDKLLSDPTVREQCAKLLANPSLMQQMSQLLAGSDMTSLTDLLNDKSSSTTPTPAAECDGEFAVGTRVRLHGLSTAEWNERVGVVAAYDASTARYTVRLDEPNGSQIAVRGRHCTPIHAETPAASASSSVG